MKAGYNKLITSWKTLTSFP